MENVPKEILGILVAKISLHTTLNLRLTCKNINYKIEKYNKYWFSLYFKKNMFKVLKESNCLPEHIKIRGYYKMEIPYMTCMTDRKGDDVDQSIVNYYKFDNWDQEAKNLGYANKVVRMDYCRYMYLKETEPDFICHNSTHYGPYPNYIFSTSDINILDNSISCFYKSEINYFLKLKNK